MQGFVTRLAENRKRSFDLLNRPAVLRDNEKDRRNGPIYPRRGRTILSLTDSYPPAPSLNFVAGASSLQPTVSTDELADRYAALRDVLGDRLIERQALAKFTTFKIGGPADLFLEVHSAEELAEAITAARSLEVPHFLLGAGANILVGDLGFRGLVIRNCADQATVDVDSGRIWAESGAICYPNLIELAVSHGLSGLEHYVGIPSTVGGALWQNLHFLSPDRSRTMFIEEVLVEAKLLTAEGEHKTVGVDYFDFGYDYSILHDRPDIVLSATFQLEQTDETRLREIMAANLEWRTKRHPPLDTEPSAGSIFRKIDGVGAGRLIDWSGLKGKRIGGAEVTRRHANILINAGGATAKDVRTLIGLIQRTVEEKQGYRLHSEIGFVGDFGDLPDLPHPNWHNQDGFVDGVPPGGHPKPHKDARKQ
ncbi:MAG: UDP-N-acetylmuramate dehydrogenase [Bacteroidetes bacterium]|nr:UDP-N-acetylmuramate dehydrogenase [Bacteroidota bacterium]